MPAASTAGAVTHFIPTNIRGFPWLISEAQAFARYRELSDFARGYTGATPAFLSCSAKRSAWRSLASMQKVKSMAYGNVQHLVDK